MGELVYLLRSGEYTTERWAADLLTDLGRRQVLIASRNLVKKGLAGNARLLTSKRPAYLRTAEIIGGLLNVEVIESDRVTRGSEHKGAVRHLGYFLLDAVNRDAKSDLTNGDTEDNRPIVAVVHEQLIASLKGVSPADVKPGIVEEFPFDTNVPDLRPDVSNYLLRPDHDPPYLRWHK